MTFFSPKKNHDLTREEAAHLTRRCGFGATSNDIERLQKLGLNLGVQQYFERQSEPHNVQHLDQGVTHYLGTDNIEPLASWWLLRMALTTNPLFEKMSLFWHGHFATSNRKIQSPRLMYQQIGLFRGDPFGSFQTLIHQISTDPAMIYWLDNNSNTKEQPNENFAREVMELFSLGIGNYTEKDIQEAARAFTGWFVHEKKFRFSERAHDPRNKTVFGHKGPWKGEDIIQFCVEQPASKRFLAKKLLKFFVHPEPPKEAIEALATLIEQANFSFTEPLKAVFQSEWFFGEENRNALIRSPVDLIVGTIRLFEYQGDIHQAEQLATSMGQSLFRPPNVKGWDGNRIWINAATLLGRQHLAHHVSQYVVSGENKFKSWGNGSPEEVVERICAKCVTGPVPEPILKKLIDYLATAPEESRFSYVAGIIEAVLMLPEYQTA
ncbi:MAG: DUF1800 domain-containing protein [Planctomycetota bacterium]